MAEQKIKLRTHLSAGIAVIPILKQFCELAPLLFGQNGITEMSIYRDRLADDARSRIREIKPGELAKFRALPLILDVREKDEFVRGHIAGAKHVSRGVLEQKICEIAPDYSGPIVVYCAGGDRGALAADNLQKLGYQNVFSLKGGLSGWLEAGGLVETPEYREAFTNRPISAAAFSSATNCSSRSGMSGTTKLCVAGSRWIAWSGKRLAEIGQCGIELLRARLLQTPCARRR